MKKILFITLLFTTLYFSNYAQQFTTESVPTIEVTGKTEKEITPNEIYLEITLNEQQNKSSIESLERKMTSIFRKLKIDIEKDLKVLDFMSNFKSYVLKRKDVIKTKKYQLIVHESAMVGKVFYELEQVGIANVDLVKVDHSDMDSFEKALKIEAIKKAQQQAKYLVEALDQTLGSPVYIRDNYIYPINQPRRMLRKSAFVGESMMMDAGAPNIEFEKIKITAEVFVKFKIEN
ncbi:DUF541 domain-containing protein [Puteibacter caeruleilacunae]|nr:DUF541 domain-containing protein [Puteibacter caeruleilacunae]